MSRFVRPDTKTLKISNGDTLTVRKRLTAGEYADYLERISTEGKDGRLKVNRLKRGLALVIAFLIDWSLVDDEGKRVQIRNLPVDELESVLKGLDPDDFKEIRNAIDEHETAMDLEREAQKKTNVGEPESKPISISPDVPA